MTNIPITPEEQEILESGIETTDELSIASHMKQSGRHLSREESHKDRTILFGFWVYLMTDFVLFSALFAVFVVLRIGMSGGVKSLAVDAPFVLTETLILLTSSFVCGMSLLAARAKNKNLVLALIATTALLGLMFVGMEYSEFAKLIAAGSSWHTNGFLSAYFTLVGTHGLHIVIGILWAGVLAGAILSRGLTRANKRKLVLWSLFWHFLDLIWIFIFTIVYLFGL